MLPPDVQCNLQRLQLTDNIIAVPWMHLLLVPVSLLVSFL